MKVWDLWYKEFNDNLSSCFRKLQEMPFAVDFSRVQTLGFKVEEMITEV